MLDFFPRSFAITPDGILLTADGLGPVLRWDGLATTTDTAGVIAPTTAPTIASSGNGAIVGIYSAFVRFVDNRENLSNLSPISNELTAASHSGVVTNASNTIPIVITTVGHLLNTGDYLKIGGVGGNLAANGTWTITRIDADTFSLNGSAGTGTYTVGGTWLRGASTITFSTVPVSTETKVVRRQLLRNTDGQATTFYVDIDTTDLVSTSFPSTKTDTQLSAGIAVPLLTPEGDLSADRYNPPPNHKAVIANHQGRMFYTVDTVVRQGMVQVTNGSTTVTGIGTAWVATLANRRFYVVGSTAAYTIVSVNAGAQTLVIDSVYAGTTDKFAVYAIRPAPAERRVIYFSEPGLAEAVPPTNQIELQDDGDELIGLLQKGSFLYFLERHHIWRYTMQTDPATDGFAFLAAFRGCLNNRCHVTVEDITYMLDSDGIHAFQGGQESQPISNPIQEIFRPSNSEFQLNLQAADYFHASLYPNQETIRWFVTFSGQDLPRHALVFNYRQKRWWIEEYNRPITANAVGDLNGLRIVYIGSDAKTTLALWQGFSDGPDPVQGTVHGAITAQTLTGLTDLTAIFPPLGVVGNPVSIVDGTGKSQTRRVVSVAGTSIAIRDPWLQLPDATSVYQLGGITWRYQCGDFRYLENEKNEPTRIELVFQAQVASATMTMKVFRDYLAIPVNWQVSKSFQAGNGVRLVAGQPGIDVDLTKANGWVQQRLDRHRDPYADGPHYVNIELSGITSAELTRIYQITLDGVME